MENKKRKAHQILNSKIQNTQFSIAQEVMLLVFNFLLVFSILFGGYQLENDRQTN